MKSPNRGPETMAQVGGNKPPSAPDLYRLMAAREECGDLFPNDVAHSDVVNLAYGRDFLTEDITYDVVLVHSVFHTNVYTAKELLTLSPTKYKDQLSPQHSPWEWARRLVSTKARLIIICDHLPFSLGPTHLGELQGYRIHKRTEHITIYVKEGDNGAASKG